MGVAGRVTGLVLLTGAVIFVCQVLGVLKEVNALPEADIVASLSGAVSMNFPRFVIYDFFFTREAYLLLHVWVVWATLRLWRRWDGVSRTDRRIWSASVLTVAAGHAIGIWVKHLGASVGVW